MREFAMNKKKLSNRDLKLKSLNEKSRKLPILYLKLPKKLKNKQISLKKAMLKTKRALMKDQL